MDSMAADEIFRIAPKDALPPGRPVAIVEIDGQMRWLIRDGEATPALVAELNQLATHVVRHGLLQPQQGGAPQPRMRAAG